MIAETARIERALPVRSFATKITHIPLLAGSIQVRQRAKKKNFQQKSSTIVQKINLQGWGISVRCNTLARMIVLQISMLKAIKSSIVTLCTRVIG